MKSKRSKIYLSGPMSGLPNLNRDAFNKAAKALREKGYKVVNPPELDKNEPQRSWEGCLRRDIMYLLQCERIATLPRWKRSRGATLEIHIGRALKYPIHPVRFYL